jgi:hypothetical protein
MSSIRPLAKRGAPPSFWALKDVIGYTTEELLDVVA